MGNKAALLLMSHGDFATEIIKSAELIIGKQDNYATLGVHIDDQIDDLKEQMFKNIEGLDTSAGLVVFTDIVGGSPMNLALNLLSMENVVVCSGLNLPMLLECAFNRDKSVEQIEEVLKAAYKNGMTILDNSSFDQEEDEDDCIL